MKLTVITLIALMLGGCLPTTDMIPHGNERIQLTKTYDLLGGNIIERTKCANGRLVNGYCPAEEKPDYSHAVVESAGEKLGQSLVFAGAFLGGMHILSNANAARITQSVTGNLQQNASTLSNGPVTIHKVP